MARARSLQSIKQITLHLYIDRSELFLVVGTDWTFGAPGPLVIFSSTSECWLENTGVSFCAIYSGLQSWKGIGSNTIL